MNWVNFQDTKSTYKHTLLYTKNELLEKENKPIYNSIKNSKRNTVEVNLTMGVNDLHPKNCKIVMKEIEEDTNGKISYIQESEEVILLKCCCYPKPSIDSE